MHPGLAAQDERRFPLHAPFLFSRRLALNFQLSSQCRWHITERAIQHRNCQKEIIDQATGWVKYATTITKRRPKTNATDSQAGHVWCALARYGAVKNIAKPAADFVIHHKPR